MHPTGPPESITCGDLQLSGGGVLVFFFKTTKEMKEVDKDSWSLLNGARCKMTEAVISQLAPICCA